MRTGLGVGLGVGGISGGGGNEPAGPLLDYMVGTNGTAIQSHTMNEGPGWTLLQGTGAIQSNQLESGTSGVALMIDSLSAYADGAVSVDTTIPGSGQFSNGLLLRMTNLNSGYAMTLENDGGSTSISLYELTME